MTRNARHESRVLQVKGLVLLLILGGLVWLSIATYSKTFVDSVDVAVHARQAGLQLPHNGDVRMRGVLIGRITGIDRRGEHVEIRLALDPDAARRVPVGATARILPTTLFGQKYVELLAPAATVDRAVRTGSVIQEDHSTETVELTRILDELEPLLTAVRPQDLSTTLQALSDGLRDRGDQFGATASAANAYLKGIRPVLPTLARDLELLGDVANTYADATPDFLSLLANSTVTGDTIVAKKEALARFLADLKTFATTSTEFFDRNGDGIIEVTRLNRPVLELLGRYSPEFPCLLGGLVYGERKAAGAFHDGKLWARVVIGSQFPGYSSSERPTYGDVGDGPFCAGMPKLSGPATVPHSQDGAGYPSGSVLPPGAP